MASSDTTVQVKISATTDGSLDAQIALAQAKVRDLDSQVGKLAKQMTTTGQEGNAALNATLKLMATDAATARQSLAGLQDVQAAELSAAKSLGEGLRAFGAASQAASAASSGLGVNVGTTTRYVRELFDEVSSGRTRMLPSTLATLLNSGIGLQGAFLAAAAAGVALVAGLGYLYEKSVLAGNALDRLKIQADFSGSFDVSKQKIQDFIDELSRLPDVTKDDAEKSAAALLHMRDMSEPAFDAMQHMLGQLAEAQGVSAPEAAKALIKAFESEKISAKELQEIFPKITQAQVDSIEHTQRLGNANATAAQLISLIKDQLEQSIPSLNSYDTAIHSSWSNWLHYLITGNAVIGTMSEHKRLIAAQTKEWEKNAKAIDDDVAALERMGNTKPQLKDIDEQFRLFVAGEQAKAAAYKSGSAERITIAQEEVNRAAELYGKDSDQYYQALTRRNEAQVAFHQREEVASKAAGQAAIEDARQKISEIAAIDDIGAKERLERTQAVWQALLAGDKLNAEQRKAVTIDLNTAIAQENKELSNQLKQIQQDDAQADLQISKMVIDAKKQDLESDFQNHLISASQKADLLRQQVEAEFAADQEVLLNKANSVRGDLTLYNQYMDQVRVLAEQKKLALSQIARQETIDVRAELNEQARAYRSMVQEVTGAEKQLISNILQGRQGLTTTLLQFIGTLLQRELQSDAAYLTQRLFFTRAELAAQKSAETGGLLVHLIAQQQKTQISATNTATRKALNATENTDFLSKIPSLIAQWLGFETAKTTATAAGTATRTTAETAAAVAGNATMIAAAAGQIAVDAAVAAAGAYAATAMIPYVGPIIAPAAAATAYGAVMSMESGLALGSAEGGAWEVGGGLWQLHPEESVLPANVANPMRDFFEGGGANGGGGVVFAPTINALDGHSVVKTLKNRATLRSMAKAYGAYMALNPSARGRY